MRTMQATEARFLVVSEVRTGYGAAVRVDRTFWRCETRVWVSGGLLGDVIVAGAWPDERRLTVKGVMKQVV